MRLCSHFNYATSRSSLLKVIKCLLHRCQAANQLLTSADSRRFWVVGKAIKFFNQPNDDGKEIKSNCLLFLINYILYTFYWKMSQSSSTLPLSCAMSVEFSFVNLHKTWMHLIKMRYIRYLCTRCDWLTREINFAIWFAEQRNKKNLKDFHDLTFSQSHGQQTTREERNQFNPSNMECVKS